MLLGREAMEVKFTLMQHEVAQAKVGDKAVVSLLTDKNTQVSGKVKTINPLVGDEGLVEVGAALEHVPSAWMDGMKVRVSLRRVQPEAYAVPKSAVVMRDGRNVVFTYRRGRAYWNYVKLDCENSTHYKITEGLKSGDSIIVKGNTRLAHLTPVQLEQ
jgi:multidrug efflux pump subunit AcrA (membrane-fusion protein)